MWGKALIVWIGLLVIAILNGAMREGLLLPAVGDRAAHAISSISLATAILVVTWMAIDWIAPRSMRKAWTIGVVWVALTLAFEFLAGHYLFNKPWEALTADYRIFDGRLWMVVLVVTLLAPASFTIKG